MLRNDIYNWRVKRNITLIVCVHKHLLTKQIIIISPAGLITSAKCTALILVINDECTSIGSLFNINEEKSSETVGGLCGEVR